MPHLEEQFPPVNPLVLQRPDALDPPDREEEEESRPIENRIEDEIPLPGSLADGSAIFLPKRAFSFLMPNIFAAMARIPVPQHPELLSRP